MDTINRSFLRERRKAAGLSQQALAKKVGRSLASINRYERGNRGIDRDTIELLSDALEIQPHQLFTRPEDDGCNPNNS